DRKPNTVKARGEPVRVFVKFPPGVELREDHLECRHVLAFMKSHRYSASVVLNRNAIIAMNGYYNIITEPLQRFVYAVIDQLIHKVVEPFHVCVSDVHGRDLSNGI